MPDVVNREAVERLRMLGGDAFLHEMIAVFIEESAQRVQTIQQAASNAFDVIRFEAHSLKSNAANLGADALAALALTLEQAAATGDLATIEARRPALPATFEEAADALRAYLPS